jgi:CDP-diacylglycerol--glycerol-3-phosphate 3-phosphatidyltransferase
MVAELQRELLRYGIAGCVLLLISASMFFMLESVRFSLCWLLLGALCWCYVCRQCWKLLALNTPDHDTSLYPTLGNANRLTLFRAFLIACTAGFLFNPFTHPALGFVPALLYTIAAICDRMDGYLARRQQRTTLLGTELDTVIDALGLVVAPLLAVLYGKVHVTYLLVSVAYYVFSWGLHWRRSHYKPVYPLLPSRLRRTMAGFQMGFVAGALWPPLDPLMTRLFGVAFMLPLLIGFCIDWLVVSGRLDTRAPPTLERFLLLGTFVQQWMMPTVRVALTALLLPVPALNPVGAVFAVCLLGVLLGMFGRACATLLMLLLCWVYPPAIVDATALLTIAGTVLIILLGTGRFSLRKADEAWINRQDGE